MVKAYQEYIPPPSEASWTLFDRQLSSIPFEFHTNHEYELTLTLNSKGQRVVGEDVSFYGDMDLVLLAPGVPHTWVSHEDSDPSAPHRALVLWLTPSFVDTMLASHIEFQPVMDLLRGSKGGVFFSQPVRLEASRRIIRMLALKPWERLIELLSLLMLLAEDKDACQLCSPGSRLRRVQPEPRF